MLTTPSGARVSATFMRRSRSDQEKLGLKPYIDPKTGEAIHTWTRFERDEYGRGFLVQYKEDTAKNEPQVVGLLEPYEKGKQIGTVAQTLGGQVTGGTPAREVTQ